MTFAEKIDSLRNNITGPVIKVKIVAGNIMKLIDIIPVENIKIPLESTVKKDIITELTDLIANSNPLVDRSAILKSIFDREATMSTGIGQGVAIPHGKSQGVKQITGSFGIIPDGVDFEALDGNPVQIFFLIAAPDGPAGPHLRCLSRLSRLLNKENFREQLLNSESAADARRIIEEGEQQFFEME